MAFQFNFCKSWTLPDGSQAFYLVGQLSRDIPFLARTGAGRLVTPFLLETEAGVTMANRSHAYKLQAGKLVPVEIPAPPLQIPNKIIKLPTLVVNDKDRVKYFPFIAADDKALAFHKGIMKGDTVCCCGEMKSLVIPGVGQRDVLQVEDVRLIRQSNRRIQAEAESEETF